MRQSEGKEVRTIISELSEYTRQLEEYIGKLKSLTRKIEELELQVKSIPEEKIEEKAAREEIARPSSRVYLTPEGVRIRRWPRQRLY